MITRNGMSIRLSHIGDSPTGRSAAGVKGIKLDQEDAVIFACQSQDAWGDTGHKRQRIYEEESYIRL